MNVHPIDYRYGSREMREVFEESKRIQLQLQVEVALVKALADLGKIPQGAAKKIELGAKQVTTERVNELEKETNHDVMALVKALTEKSGDAGRYVHLTATSCDIVDTAISLQLKQATGILLQKSRKLLKVWLDLARKYEGTVMIGRTHGQHAIPITLGFKFANYADKLGNDILWTEEFYKHCLKGKFSGAVGSYAAQQVIGIDGGALEEKICGRLGINPALISMQTIPRENYARLSSALAIMAGTLEQAGKEVRNLQRTEIGELSEPFGKKQVGSSTMAQKRNPINCENICSNARVVRANLMPLLENIALEHERDLTNSAAERSVFPTMFVLLDDMLERSIKVFSGLQVFEDRMKENLELTKGTVMAEAVITELVNRGVGRQDAHEVLRTASFKALSEGKHLKEILLADKKVSTKIKKAELEELMKYENYTGLCKEKTRAVVEKWVKAV